MVSLRQLTTLTFAGILTFAAMAFAPVARANMALGNYNLQIIGRYDFHTWLWSISWCTSTCVHVNATAMPVAKAFNYVGDAQLVNGRYFYRRCSRWPEM